MKRLAFTGLFGLFGLCILLTFYGHSQAADQATVYLPRIECATCFGGSISTPPDVSPTPTPTVTSTAVITGLPSYTGLSMDVNASVAKEATAINFVNNPPNVTTTITDVQSVDFEMGDLVGTNGNGKVYSYTHVTKALTEYCVVFKAYRTNNDSFLTAIVTACYASVDSTLDPNDRYHDAYMILNQTFEFYAHG